jgi:hypothetical protein
VQAENSRIDATTPTPTMIIASEHSMSVNPRAV